MTLSAPSSTGTLEGSPPASPSRKSPSAQLGSLAANAVVRRLGLCVVGCLVLAIMTGPEGTNSAPTSGFTGSLQFPRLFWFLGVGLVLFAAVWIWHSFGKALTAVAGRLREWVITATAQRWVRLSSAAAIVAAGFVWVSWISPSDTWKGGVCIQVGCVLAAMELVTYIFQSRSLRSARLCGYAFLACYGALAWVHNSISRYLNSIGAIPHDRTLGRAVLWVALSLFVLEALLFALTVARKVTVPRRKRGFTASAAAVLVVYGWLMWTTWSMWRTSTPHSLAHWLASIHVLPHNGPAGITVMSIGGALALFSLVWTGSDIAAALRGSLPPHARFQFTGITKQAKFPYGKAAFTMAALLVAVEWPLHMNPGVQSILTTQVAIYILLSMGLNVVVGFAGLLDLGYIAFWAIGAYTTAYFTGALPVQPPFLLNPFWVIPFAIVAAMLTGVLLGTPTLRLRGDYLAIVTLGFGEIIEIVANNLNRVTGGPEGTPGFIPQFSFHVFSVKYHWKGTVLPYYYLILAVAVVFMVAFRFLEHSRVGRSWTAIREDEVAADSLGINALKYKVMAFAIGASTSGFAGVFFASQVQSLVPYDFTVQTSILILVFVIFGGMGSIAGAVVGAFVIQWLPQYLNYRQFSGYNQQDEFIYLGALLILLMIFRPQGIIPSRRRRREILLTEEGIGHPEAPGGPVRLVSMGEELPSSYGKLSLDEPGYVGPETE
ncbi:MAG TPA: branched-chain amino acid ABC transporter permease [Acidimicrobiales bacterium]|nr:branched-chain amino acid ABC transporter permease [Acidimicrobiales bacterium]